jgi:uncharacterized protein (TIGR02217 family)
MTAFHEFLLPKEIAYGSSGGPKFKTTVFTSYMGYEQRNIDWELPLGNYDVSYGIKTQGEMNEIANLFQNVKGRGEGFRFYDWNDFKVENEIIGYGDGLTTTFQVYKNYRETDHNGNEHVYFTRKVTKIAWDSESDIALGVKPVGTTADTDGQYYTIDYDAGTLTFAIAPDPAVEVRVGYAEFHYPVHFGIDTLDANHSAYSVSTWANVTIEEYRFDDLGTWSPMLTPAYVNVAIADGATLGTSIGTFLSPVDTNPSTKGWGVGGNPVTANLGDTGGYIAVAPIKNENAMYLMTIANWGSGGTTPIKIYRVAVGVGTAVASTLIGTINPADVDSEWTQFIGAGGIMYDETDGNIMFFVGKTGGASPAGSSFQYLLKYDVKTASIVWKQPTNIVLYGRSHNATSLIKGGLYTYYGARGDSSNGAGDGGLSGQVGIFTVNTITGATTRVNKAIAMATEGSQYYNGGDRTILLCGSFGAGDPLPTRWMLYNVVKDTFTDFLSPVSDVQTHITHTATPDWRHKRFYCGTTGAVAQVSLVCFSLIDGTSVNKDASEMGVSTIYGEKLMIGEDGFLYAGSSNGSNQIIYWKLDPVTLRKVGQFGPAATIFPGYYRDGFGINSQSLQFRVMWPVSPLNLNFHEELFPPEISFGSSGGPQYRTSVFAADSGYEARVIEWDTPRYAYDASHGIKSWEQMDALTAFFLGRRGKAIPFRYKDWADYQIAAQLIGVGDGTTTEFQLVKTYRYAQAETGEAATRTRKLKKIAWGSVGGVTVGGNTVTETPDVDGQSYYLDYNTGIITFAIAPEDGDNIIIGSAEFHVPVRFDTDALEVTQEFWETSTWPHIPLIEVLDWTEALST